MKYVNHKLIINHYRPVRNKSIIKEINQLYSIVDDKVENRWRTYQRKNHCECWWVPKKLLRSSIKIDDLASLVGHQRKRYNHSSTFNALNHDNYSPAINSHQDYNHYTLESNHLKLCKGIHLRAKWLPRPLLRTFLRQGPKYENGSNLPLGSLEVFIYGESFPKFQMYNEQKANGVLTRENLNANNKSVEKV